MKTKAQLRNIAEENVRRAHSLTADAPLTDDHIQAIDAEVERLALAESLNPSHRGHEGLASYDDTPGFRGDDL